MNIKKILIADDYPIFREGLRSILARIPGLEVIGEAENGKVAIEQAKLLRPHIILIDLAMPIMNGTEAIRIIKQREPATKIIALTAQKTRDHVEATLAAGANGYVLKDDSCNSLMAAIESILNDQVYLSSGVCDTVLSGFLGNSENAKSAASWCRLSGREREVIKLVAEGYKNREIACYLSLSIKTIEKHRSSLMSKLKLRSVPALTAYAIEHSLISM